MKAKIQKRGKGFTIVELVIVIGVIGILSAILVPVFVNVSKDAQLASDKSFVHNANKRLAVSEASTGAKIETMSDAQAVCAADGIDVIAFKPSQGDFVWDSQTRTFALINEDGSIIYADGDHDTSELYRFFKVYDTRPASETYSIYAGSNWSTDVLDDLSVGFDAGAYTGLVSVSYSGVAGEARSVIIDSGANPTAEVSVDAPLDTIDHYGEAEFINVESVAMHSYRERGRVERIAVTSGHVRIETTARVNDSIYVVGDEAEHEILVDGHQSGEAPAAKVEYMPGASVDEVRGGPIDVGSWQISGLAAPAFVTTYQTRTATLDPYATKENVTAAAEHRSNFFENDDHEADLYKVGIQNSLSFGPAAVYTNPVTLDTRTVTSAPLTVSAKVKQGNEYVNTSKVFYGNRKIQFRSGVAAGEIYKLHFCANPADPDNPATSFDFEFKTVDGYNVTKAYELALFDNRSMVMDKNVFGNKAVDMDKYFHGVVNEANPYGDSVIDDVNPWGTTKARYELTNVNVNGLVLHGDIRLTKTSLPDMFFYSKTEIERYIANYASDFAAWCENMGLTAQQGKATLIGSMKDNRSAYLRVTRPGKVFNFEGNYFNIDVSNLPLIYSFYLGSGSAGLQYGIERGRMATGDKPSITNEGSHGALFETNFTKALFYNNPPSQTNLYENVHLGGGGEVYFSNLTVLGNGQRSSDIKYKGGVIPFKLEASKHYFRNVITSNTFISYQTKNLLQDGHYSATNSTFSEYDSTDYSAYTNLYRRPYPTEFHMDRCKSYDSYNSMFYIMSQNNEIKNSCAQGAGGAIFLMDEFGTDHDNKTNRGSYIRNPAEVDCQNVFFENWVYADAAWFAQNHATELMTTVGSVGMDLAAVGGKVFAKKDSSDKLMVNVIAIHMVTAAALSNSYANGGGRLKGHILVDGHGLNMGAFNGITTPTQVADYYRDGETSEGVYNGSNARGIWGTVDAATAGLNQMMILQSTAMESNASSVTENPATWSDYIYAPSDMFSVKPSLVQGDFTSMYLRAAPSLFYMGLFLGME